MKAEKSKLPPNHTPTEYAARLSSEWCVNAALTGKKWLAEYYLKKAVMLECKAIGERKQPNNKIQP